MQLRAVFGTYAIPTKMITAGPRAIQERVLSDARRNRFRHFDEQTWARLGPLGRHIDDLALGTCTPPRTAWAQRYELPGNGTFLFRLLESKGPVDPDALAELDLGDDWSADAAADVAAARVLLGAHVSPLQRSVLRRATLRESSWARRLVLATCLAKLHLRENAPRPAATALAIATQGYYELQRRVLRRGGHSRDGLLRGYESLSERILSAMGTDLAAGGNPVATLARVVRAMVPAKKAPSSRAIDALDALVAAGSSMEAQDVQEHVVRELAKMLGARVLLHYEGGVYRQREEQSVHTLTTWTMRRLVADRRLVARRVRPRPEFWRPEQRRPRGVLSVPLGEGLLVLSRGRRFRPQELRAVRAVLQFLERRLATPAHAPVPRPRPAPGRTMLPTVSEGLVGTSEAWRIVLDQVRKVAPSDCSIVLLGETGTGKERLARAIHACSRRAHQAFVPLNCGAVPAELVASELFGHVRGAFTGADRNRDGAFVQAHRGTLFFDEVGDTPHPMQVALLRALEERRVTPVGGGRTRDVDVRVLAATHLDLEALVRAGSFREDLWHRLNVIVLRVPPLRERLSDLPLLAAHILARTEEGKSLHPDGLEVLSRYGWPGNVRELENVLRAASLVGEGSELSADLLERMLDGRRAATAAAQGRRLPSGHALLDRLADAWASTADIARLTGSSVRTVNRQIGALVKQGLVESCGQGRASRYRRSAHAWRALARSGGDQPIRRGFSTSQL